MTAYSLRQPFTLEDAKALLDKRADITVDAGRLIPATELHADALVVAVYQRPGTDRGYLEISGDRGEQYVPFGDVREVTLAGTE